MNRLFVLSLAALALWAGEARAQSQVLPVIIVPGLELADLQALEKRGAVGMVVPGAGPTTSGADARAALVRGEVRNSLRGGPPSGPVLIELATAAEVPRGGPAIVLGLPAGGEQANDERYPIAVLGGDFEGLLVSDSTRIPGLVSIADVAPTALGRENSLTSQGSEDASAEVLELDARIRDNRVSGVAATLLAALLLLVLAWFIPQAAVLGFSAGLAANLVLGAAGISEPWVVIAVIGFAIAVGAPLVARVTEGEAEVGLVLAGVVVAYLAALGLDGASVSLSPLGPTQNSRFYGLSNLLETLLLVPALAGAALLTRRFGPAAFGVVALVTLLAVAGDRFGADGGGAIVVGVGFAVLAVELGGGGRRALALGLGGAAALVAILVGIDAATGGSSHVAQSVRDGPGSLAADLRDRVALSFERATVSWYVALVVVAAAVALVVLLIRLLRSDAPPEERAVPVALAAAVLTSLVVNDSPSEIAVGGLIGFVSCRPGTLAGHASPPTARRFWHCSQSPSWWRAAAAARRWSPCLRRFEGEIPQQTLPEGDAEAGATVFEEAGCGSCHTFEPAGTEAEIGPNLDESLQGKDAEYDPDVDREPDAEIAEGFQAGIMPKDYGEKLDDKQLADLVAFLQQ